MKYQGDKNNVKYVAFELIKRAWVLRDPKKTLTIHQSLSETAEDAFKDGCMHLGGDS